jgi:hypothetical protein
MVKPKLPIKDKYNLHYNQLMLEKVTKQSNHLQKLLNAWKGKLNTTEIFEMCFILGLNSRTVKSYIKDKRRSFKIHIGLAILCYLELNFAHLKD